MKDPLIRAAIGGLISAILVDLHAWSQTRETFDWGLAVRRWFIGAVAGAASGLGVR